MFAAVGTSSCSWNWQPVSGEGENKEAAPWTGVKEAADTQRVDTRFEQSVAAAFPLDTLRIVFDMSTGWLVSGMTRLEGVAAQAADAELDVFAGIVEPAPDTAAAAAGDTGVVVPVVATLAAVAETAAGLDAGDGPVGFVAAGHT